MSFSQFSQDAVVIGGGFYGAAIAIYLVKERGFKKVTLIEQEQKILSRASYTNQARVHNGYHYPRSFTTAYRSRVNLPRFVKDWPEAVKSDFTKLYAIARRNSKVTAKQFERFCRDIGASVRPVEPGILALFESRLIEQAFLVEEYAFDTTKLARWAVSELNACDVVMRMGTTVKSLHKSPNGFLQVISESDSGIQDATMCKYVFNCTYSGLNHFNGDYPGVSSELKQEITEMALLKMPESLADLGVTVMDGPFFSFMPFPARDLHSLSHVRYTPHMHWTDEYHVNPYERLKTYDRNTRVDRMIRDVGRYIPDVLKAKYVDSLFEVKTVLVKNEGDDGRPILFERHQDLVGCYSVLGGKIDNIYDVLEKLEAEDFSPAINNFSGAEK